MCPTGCHGWEHGGETIGIEVSRHIESVQMAQGVGQGMGKVIRYLKCVLLGVYRATSGMDRPCH